MPNTLRAIFDVDGSSGSRKWDVLRVHCFKAFLTGWANVLTFVRYGCFGTMQTGNGILLARAAADARWDDAAFFFIQMLVYYVGLVVYRGIDVYLGHRSCGLAVAPFYFALFCATDACVWRYGDTRYELTFVSLAFGGMNSLAVQISHVVTHAITGNLNRVANAVFDHLFEHEGHGLSEAQRHEAELSLGVSVTFLAGVATCAQFVHTFRHLSRFGFLPVAVAQWLWLWSHDIVFAKELEAKQASRLAALLAAAAKASTSSYTSVHHGTAKRHARAGSGGHTSSLQLDLLPSSASFPAELQVGLLPAEFLLPSKPKEDGTS